MWSLLISGMLVSFLIFPSDDHVEEIFVSRPFSLFSLPLLPEEHPLHSYPFGTAITSNIIENCTS